MLAGIFTQRVSRSEREANYCPFIVEVKNEWRYASFLGVCLLKLDADKFAPKAL